jgi:hypothetical protein
LPFLSVPYRSSSLTALTTRSAKQPFLRSSRNT